MSKNIIQQKLATARIKSLKIIVNAASSITLALFVAVLMASALQADEARIVDAKISADGDDKYRISVTISHADEGWDHYANGWDVMDDSGNILGTRVLHHPHVNEQPFTRALSLKIPRGIKYVTIVAHDSVHEDNPETYKVKIPGR